MESPFARPGRQLSRITPEDEQRAAKIAGLCDTYLREVGFVLVEVGPDYVIYEDRTGYQVAIQGHCWFCKPPNDREFSGCGYVGLEEVIRGGTLEEPVETVAPPARIRLFKRDSIPVEGTEMAEILTGGKQAPRGVDATNRYIEMQTDDLEVLTDFFKRQILLGEPLEISVSKSDWLYKMVVTPCTEEEEENSPENAC